MRRVCRASALAAVLLALVTAPLAASQSEEQVWMAVQAAAEHLQVPPEEIQVVRTEETDWPDSSLGCPQPGRFYLQVITPGWLVELESGPVMLQVHGSTGGQVVLCSEWSAPDETESGMIPDMAPELTLEGEPPLEPDPTSEEQLAAE